MTTTRDRAIACAEDGNLSIMIRTGPHLQQAREAMGWTHADLARALRLAGDPDQGEKRVREMESGRRQITGPVAVAVESFLHGFKPVGFQEEAAVPVRRSA
jgi:hypothetical protein